MAEESAKSLGMSKSGDNAYRSGFVFALSLKKMRNHHVIVLIGRALFHYFHSSVDRHPNADGKELQISSSQMSSDMFLQPLAQI